MNENRALLQIPATFAFQSYLDTGQMLVEDVGAPIIGSTRKFANGVSGVGVALHPSSQSPVAIKFKGGKTDSAVVVLTPGQTIKGEFGGFEWGLPFGWLGGGTVVLYVIRDPDAQVVFPSVRRPIIFHRFRTTVVLGAIDNAPTINFPLAFPWSNAIRVNGGNSEPQPASPVFSIDPDIALLQLNTVIAGPTVLTVQIQNCDPFDLNSAPDQAAGYANQNHYFDVTFNPTANAQTAVAWLPPEIHRLGGDFAAFSILDPGVPAVIPGGTTLDVVRYGRIG